MLQVNTTTNIKQGISNTVTVFDDKETARQRREQEAAVQWFAERMLRAETEVFSETAVITPAVAKVLLQRNPDNRRIRQGRLAEIRADLENGRWVFNGESIIVAKGGVMNDGQHRMMAVRDSGVPMKAVIVFGVQRSSRLTIDQGTVRTTADYLEMSGNAYESNAVAAISRMLLQYEKHSTIDTKRVHGQQPPTKSEIHGFAVDNGKEITKALSRLTKGWSSIGTKSLFAVAHILFARRDEDAANVFIDRLLDGANIGPGNIIYILRERLLADQKMKPWDRFEAIVRAWNAMRRGENIARIQIMGRLPKIEA